MGQFYDPKIDVARLEHAECGHVKWRTNGKNLAGSHVVWQFFSIPAHEWEELEIHIFFDCCCSFSGGRPFLVSPKASERVRSPFVRRVPWGWVLGRVLSYVCVCPCARVYTSVNDSASARDVHVSFL